MFDKETADYIANLVTQTNWQLFQAIQQAPKDLVMEEPRGPSQLIEIKVLQNGLSQVVFPDLANLRNTTEQTVVIKSLKLITPSVLTFGPTSGLPTAPLTELQKMSLELYAEQWIKGANIPILTLNDMFTEGSGEPYRREKVRLNNWKNFDWGNNTKIIFSNGTVSVIPAGGYVVILEAEYIKLNKNGAEIIGPA